MEEHPDIAEHIRTYSDSPRDALLQARRHKAEQRKDWFDVNVEVVSVLRAEYSSPVRDSGSVDGHCDICEV